MKTVNGGLVIIVAVAILWIVGTGKIPAALAAWNALTGSKGSTPGTTKTGSTQTAPGNTPQSSVTAPINSIWSQALNSIQSYQWPTFNAPSGTGSGSGGGGLLTQFYAPNDPSYGGGVTSAQQAEPGF